MKNKTYYTCTPDFPLIFYVKGMTCCLLSCIYFFKKLDDTSFIYLEFVHWQGGRKIEQ